MIAERDIISKRPTPLPTRKRAIAHVAGVAAAYAILARLGLLLDPVGGFASVVWAPTGIAIAALLLLGRHATIGIWLGAFIANVLSGAPVPAAAAIAAGNSLEAMAAVAALSRVRGFERSLDSLSDIYAFTVAAAVLAPFVSASLGVLSLHFAGVLPAAQLAPAWSAWWLGDAIGALVVAPPLLIWTARGSRDLGPRRLEAAAILAALAAIAGTVFFAEAPIDRTSFIRAYLVFPVLIWAAVRFEQRGATVAVLLTCVIAIAGTAHGHGPFATPRLRDSLFRLQAFMGIVTLCFLVLATAIAERERALRAASHAMLSAGVANRAKSDFLAAMSHELRTPLNAIAGYAQLLGMNIHGELTSEQRDAVTRIETNQRHLASLVEDVLSFTRVEAGVMALRPAPVSVSESLLQLPQFVEPEAQRRGVRLSIASIDPTLVAQADPERLRQILLNLVMNAIKYTDAGGTVDVAAGRDGGRVAITVSDTGIGVPAAQLDRVFEPFFQVDRGHTRRYSGVGLGLTISRDLARAMGGDVLLASENGKGTRATVVLPQASASA
jgi:signal transduction histidine kinase